MFPIDPLLAKVLLLSYIVGCFRETLQRVSFLSTTESLMNLNFESKKRYFSEKIKLGESRTRNSDFECWEELFRFNKNLFHRKALKNISKIETQLSDILERVPRSKIFFAVCKDGVFRHLMQKALLNLDGKHKMQIDFLLGVMGSRESRDVATLCALDASVSSLLGLDSKFAKKMKKRSSEKVRFEDFAESRISKIRNKKIKVKRKKMKMDSFFSENSQEK